MVCHPDTKLSSSRPRRIPSLWLLFLEDCFSFLQPFHYVKNKLLEKMRKQTFPHDEVPVLELRPRSNKVLPK